MRRFLKFSLAYAIAGLAAGVFFREFTRFNGWTQTTTLSAVHPHLLALGMLGFMILALFEGRLQFSESRFCRPFLIFYNSGLIVAAVMLLVRGIWQVKGLDDIAAISGIAGIGHILLAVGIFLLFAALFDALNKQKTHRPARQR